MSPFEQSIQSLSTIMINPWLLVKILFLIGLSVYIAFAIVVIRQVVLMNRTLKGNFSWLLKLLTWAHLIVAIGVWLLAFKTL